MDEIDVTNRRLEIEQKAIEARLKAAREAAVSRDAATECEDCGEEIPQARREAMPGCTRCAECQQMHERQQAFGKWMRPFLR